MFKFVAIVLMAIFACVFAKPGLVAPVAYTAPVAYSAPVAYTAPAEALVSRSYHGNGFVHPLTYAAPYVAAPAAYAAYTAPVVL